MGRGLPRVPLQGEARLCRLRLPHERGDLTPDVLADGRKGLGELLTWGRVGAREALAWKEAQFDILWDDRLGGGRPGASVPPEAEGATGRHRLGILCQEAALPLPRDGVDGLQVPQDALYDVVADLRRKLPNLDPLQTVAALPKVRK